MPFSLLQQVGDRAKWANRREKSSREHSWGQHRDQKFYHLACPNLRL